MLEELVEVELESGEGCDLHYIDTITFEETSPSLDIPHVLERLRHIQALILGGSDLSQYL